MFLRVRFSTLKIEEKAYDYFYKIKGLMYELKCLYQSDISVEEKITKGFLIASDVRRDG